jgi:hypothetical protein
VKPAQIASNMQRGIWLPGDGPQMRMAFTRPAGLWLRVCHVRDIAQIVAGFETTRERAA